jgi:hypothetical protein
LPPHGYQGLKAEKQFNCLATIAEIMSAFWRRLDGTLGIAGCGKGKPAAGQAASG